MTGTLTMNQQLAFTTYDAYQTYHPPGLKYRQKYISVFIYFAYI